MWIGYGLSALAVVLFATFWKPIGSYLSGGFFYAFGLASVIGAVATITSKNPIHSALWFASVVLATAGLFLLAGAQFLAAGTMIVYAGGDHRDLPLRHHARPDGRPGHLRPDGPVAVPGRPSAASSCCSG